MDSLEPARRHTGAAEAGAVHGRTDEGTDSPRTALLRAKFPHLEKPHFCSGSGAAKASARHPHRYSGYWMTGFNDPKAIYKMDRRRILQNL